MIALCMKFLLLICFVLFQLWLLIICVAFSGSRQKSGMEEEDQEENQEEKQHE